MDVTVRLGETEISTLLACVSDVGFHPSNEFSENLVRATRVVPLIYMPAKLPIDMVYIRETLSMIEDALGQSDLLSLFETEFSQAKRADH